MSKNQHQRISLYLENKEVISALLRSLSGVKRLLLVRGHKSYHLCGAKKIFDEVSDISGIEMVEFEDFEENPKKEDVDVGVDLVLKFEPDMAVAVGGGSVLDMAKLIRYYSGHHFKLLAIPTTAGTGAESTQFAVCYIDGIKHSISDESILPDEVILYPPFTYGNGRYLTACTGFDALAQAIEAYWNINSTNDSDRYALRAIQHLYPILLKADLENRDRDVLMKAANDAGKAINITRTTVPHALSYTLTSKYGYPHGHAVALTFPFFFRYNVEGEQSRFMGNDYQKFSTKMDRLRSLLNAGDDPYYMMKNYVSQLGLGFDPDRDFDDCVVAKGLNLERAKNTPVAIDDKVIMAAVKSIREI